jgi:hypothetical protein
LAKLNTQVTFKGDPYCEYKNIIVDANAGTVILAVELDTGEWLDVETFSADGMFTRWLKNTTFRLTPTGAATYAVY